MKDEIAELYGKRKYDILWVGIEQKDETKEFAEEILALLKREGWVDRPTKAKFYFT